MKTKKRQKFICLKTLKKRWGNKLIEKFYPIADKEVENPYYAKASPMKLYDLSKVERIEKYKRFIKMKEGFDKASKVAKKAVHTKYENSIKYAKEVEISIPSYSRKELEDVAFQHWYDWKYSKTMDDDFEYSGHCSEKDLKRWCVNYLRHECTSYDYNLSHLYGNVGVQDAHDILKDRINNAIFEKYDWLR